MASTNIELENVRLAEEGRFIISRYKVSHSQSGRAGTHLELGLEVKRGLGRCYVAIDGLNVEGKEDEVEAALDKLAAWLDRASIALKNRGAPRSIVAGYNQAIIDENDS